MPSSSYLFIAGGSSGIGSSRQYCFEIAALYDHLPKRHLRANDTRSSFDGVNSRGTLGAEQLIDLRKSMAMFMASKMQSSIARYGGILTKASIGSLQ